uniref:Uncharacterized protein n=1 Tax=Arundo donax TaxID=35708 RepID=A0A0A9DBT4_ARUDO
MRFILFFFPSPTRRNTCAV